jgi:nicotinamidase-related amidase
MDTSFTLLIIDAQNDFHANGSLAVAGAYSDSERIAQLIRENLDKIDDIVVTLDTHNPEHIAHAVFWNSEEDGSGSMPTPFQRITHDDVVNRKWFPVDKALQEHCLKYTKALEEKGRFTLTIWPAHCLVGTKGHDIVSNIQGALDEWSARHEGRSVTRVNKGQNNLTEMYSAIEAEVPVPDDVRTHTNSTLVQQLKNAKKVVVCGQALSHCVNYTTRDILKNWDPRDTADIVVLTDASSAVTGCQEDATKFLTDMKESGVTLTTTDKLFSA